MKTISDGHSFQLLANVGYVRDTGPEHLVWKKVGKLFYHSEQHKVRLLLNGFRQGICAGKPNNIKDPPFIQGDIMYPCGVRGEEVEHLFVGWVTTSETEKGETLYTVKLECCPFTTSTQLWLNVNLEDGDEYASDVQCPF